MAHDAVSPTQELIALLEGEILALTRGDFGALAQSLDRKETLVAQLRAIGVADARGLADLKTVAQRNGTLLLAAGKGLRAARRRVQDLLRAERGETYDAAGRRTDLAGNRPRFERKA